MTLIYKRNNAGTLQAAYCGNVRIGYVETTASDRWLWSLNTIQPKGGRATGIEDAEGTAKEALSNAWLAWIEAAGLRLVEEGVM